MRQTTDPEWLKDGAEVAHFTDRRGDINAIHFTRVERMTKTLVITEDGYRFNRRSLQIRTGGTWDSVTRVLLSASNPKVAEVERDLETRRKKTRAMNSCHDYVGRRTDVSPVDVILAMAPLTGVEQEIRALFDRETQGS